MEGKKAIKTSRTAERRWVTMRVTQEEKLRLSNQAELAGLSLSEYMRRNFFGGKPLIAHTDLKVFMELRRIGGLLKHNFSTLRAAKIPKTSIEEMDASLKELDGILKKIGSLFHDS